MTPLSAPHALDAYFLEARARLLDLAAFLDRVERGADAVAVRDDPRWRKVRQALTLLQEQPNGRAEAVQQLFSLEYDPNWQRPKPR